MQKRFKAALVTMLVTLGMLVIAPVVLNDGILDALCSLVEKGGTEWILLGCVDHNSPNGG